MDDPDFDPDEYDRTHEGRFELVDDDRFERLHDTSEHIKALLNEFDTILRKTNIQTLPQLLNVYSCTEKLRHTLLQYHSRIHTIRTNITPDDPNLKSEMSQELARIREVRRRQVLHQLT